MEETISLKELFQVLRKRISMILTITFVAALISAIVSFYFITPIYQSSTQILVNQKKDSGQIQAAQVQTDLQLINTYNVIIKSPAILDQVKENLKLDMTVQQLTGKITVASEKNSQVIAITVQDADPTQAKNIANTTAQVFKEQVAKIMSVDNVTILSQAEVAEGQAPVKPRPLLNIAIAVVVGLMASVGLAFLLEYLDNTIKKEQDVEQLLGLPVLGVIAQIEESNEIVSKAVAKVRERTIGS